MRLLLTWTDRSVLRSHHTRRPAEDRGPILRMLEQPEFRGLYSESLVLTTPGAVAGAESLAALMGPLIPKVTTRCLDITDPSDYRQLFDRLSELLTTLLPSLPSRMPIDVVLSAGTPQAQTLWVILVQAGLLNARMLQVIPPAFVPVPHPKAVREVRLDFERFPEIGALRAEVTRLRARDNVHENLIGDGPAMTRLKALVSRVAPSDLPMLILGETGSGKELVARALHRSSERSAGPFIAENCGALADGVLESELFGHERGAFTGANKLRRGLFEQAHGGTLFLDEVAELPARVQAMLLRVLQEGTIRRVGGEDRVPVDVRIVAATHRDLRAMVADGTFREDLWYRLKGAIVAVPALRERPEDLPALVAHFLAERRSKLEVPRETWRVLGAYAWPGNVRELRAEVLRWTVFCDAVVTASDLTSDLSSALNSDSSGIVLEASAGPSQVAQPMASEPSIRPLRETLAEVERAAICAAFEQLDGNKAQTAAALCIDRNTLKRKLKQFGL